MVELVVVSGKGGTGKTSIVASFAALAANAVLADCDVDASDLHLVLAPRTERQTDFRSGHQAVIRHADCTRCGICRSLCRFDAVRVGSPARGNGAYAIDPTVCEGCGVCVRFCPVHAIDFPEHLCGEWFVSATRFGPMVHARLEAGAESSGKLVTTVRTEARRIGEGRGSGWILVDGPPGIGCPVIASITGSTRVLGVTEPTMSGAHDLSRLLDLVRHFGVPCAVCVNKWDLNRDLTEKIEGAAAASGASVLRRIPYDGRVTAAQREGKTVVEYGDGPAAREIRLLWEDVCRMSR